MRRPRLAVRAALLVPTFALVSLLGCLSRVPAAGANEALGTTGLAGNGLVRVAPLAGPDVAVVAWSAPVDGRVAIVVANGTSGAERVRTVVAIATAAGGSRAVRAKTDTVVPRVLGPGEWALGSVRFRAGSVRFDDTFTFDVTTGRARAKDPVALGDERLRAVAARHRTGRADARLHGDERHDGSGEGARRSPRGLPGRGGYTGSVGVGQGRHA